MNETDKWAIGFLFALVLIVQGFCTLVIKMKLNEVETQVKNLKPVSADCSGIVTRDPWDPFMGKKFIIDKHYFPPVERKTND